MKILIFGANGMLGTYVSTYLKNKYEVIRVTRQDYDLSNINIETLKKFLKEKKLQEDDIVINCAGVIPQASKQRELNTRTYFIINSIFPIILSTICSEINAKFIHITTDCVFSGHDGNYNEKSLHDETNDYGMSKSLGEICDATIIRTSIIGEEINNKRSLVEWVKSNRDGEINGYINHWWNGITCLECSKIIHKIINENLFWKGVRHIYGPESVTKFQLVFMINSTYDLNITIKEFSTENKIDKTIGTIYPQIFSIPSLNEQIKEMKDFKL